MATWGFDRLRWWNLLRRETVVQPEILGFSKGVCPHCGQQVMLERHRLELREFDDLGITPLDDVGPAGEVLMCPNCYRRHGWGPQESR